jgi:hypothetical protein
MSENNYPIFCQSDKEIFSHLKICIRSTFEKHLPSLKIEEDEKFQPQNEHKFILPPSFRNGENINIKVMEKYFNFEHKSGWDIFIGFDAIEIGINFLSEKEKDYSFLDSDEVRTNCFKYDFQMFCQKCKDYSKKELYTYSDIVHPLRYFFFNATDTNCFDCRSFYLEGEEQLIDSTLDSCNLLKDLVSIIKSYLPLEQSIFSMKKPVEKKEYGSSTFLVPTEKTSFITEWLPFSYHHGCYGITTLFVNCNPDSKFYETIFSICSNITLNKRINFNC